MIPKAKSSSLVAIYLYICHLHEIELRHITRRYSNNNQPVFTNQEIMTIHLYVIQEDRRFRIIEIYSFVNEYLRDLFPALPSSRLFSAQKNAFSRTDSCNSSFRK